MIKKQQEEQNYKRIIFCGVKGCCPTLEVKNKTIIISDDFGGRIKISKNQLKSLVDAAIKEKLI
jgi:hypothetical protein